MCLCLSAPPPGGRGGLFAKRFAKRFANSFAKRLLPGALSRPLGSPWAGAGPWGRGSCSRSVSCSSQAAPGNASRTAARPCGAQPARACPRACSRSCSRSVSRTACCDPGNHTLDHVLTGCTESAPQGPLAAVFGAPETPVRAKRHLNYHSNRRRSRHPGRVTTPGPRSAPGALPWHTPDSHGWPPRVCVCV